MRTVTASSKSVHAVRRVLRRLDTEPGAGPVAGTACTLQVPDYTCFAWEGMAPRNPSARASLQSRFLADWGLPGVLGLAYTPGEKVMTEGTQQPTPRSKREVKRLAKGDHVAVIGGGPAGLTAAYLLAKQGVQVTVFEATDMVGGISRTEVYKGYRFDIGGHRFFTKIEPVQELWDEILGEDFMDVPRLSRIYYNNKFFNYPLKARNALMGLGIFRSITIVLSYLKAQMFPSKEEVNFEQWVCNRFGRKLFETFFKTYTEKVWGMKCTEIRAEWAAQRIKNLSLGKAILNAASMNKRAEPRRSRRLINEFQYPRLGPGQMWEACTRPHPRAWAARSA